IGEADVLIQRVMRDRGYPTEDFDRRAADVSVDHPDVVNNYRAAHGISVAHTRGNASTEDLRQALVHYRALFDELLESREPERARGDSRAGEPAGDRNRDRDADRESRVREPDRCSPAASREQERADAEERRRQQPAEEVVGPEGPRVPPGCGAPRKGGARE